MHSTFENELETRLLLFDSVISPILLYARMGLQDLNKIEVFTKNFQRRILKLIPMVFGELGRHEIEVTVRKRMVNV